MRLRWFVPLLAAVPCWCGPYIMTDIYSGIRAYDVEAAINSSHQVVMNLTPSGTALWQSSTLTSLTYAGIMDINDSGNTMGRYAGASIVRSSTGDLVLTLGASYRGLGLSNSGLVAGLNTSYEGFVYDPSTTSYTTLAHGSNMTFATDINDARMVAGYWDATPTKHAFVWLAGTIYELNVPGASATAGGAMAVGINNAGQVAGRAWDADGEFGWVFTGNPMTGAGSYEIVRISGATNTSVWRINEGGDIVGTYEDADGVRHAFMGVEGTAVPEPAAVVLMGLGLAGLALLRRKRA